MHQSSTVARNENIFFIYGRVLTEFFLSPMHHSTVARNENIFFFGGDRVPIEFLSYRELYNDVNIAQSKNLKNGENSGNISKVLNLKKLGSRECYRENFSKLAQLEIPKNRAELYNDVNIAKSKN